MLKSCLFLFLVIHRMIMFINLYNDIMTPLLYENIGSIITLSTLNPFIIYEVGEAVLLQYSYDNPLFCFKLPSTVIVRKFDVEALTTKSIIPGRYFAVLTLFLIDIDHPQFLMKIASQCL